MSPARLLPLLLTLCLAIAPAFGQATDQPQTPADNAPTQITLFNQAIQALRQTQLDEARTDLQSIIDRNDKDITQYMAQVLLLQINGSYAKRQQQYLNLRQVDTLVLVPDVQSFYAAIGHWTDTTYFPVLIDDGWYAPAFARAFKPKQIVRFNVKETDDAAALDALVKAHNQSFATFAPGQAPPNSFTPPPGLVVIDPQSDLAPAGFALAKARHQPVLLHHSDMKLRQIIDLSQVNELNEAFMQAAAKYGLLNLSQWAGLTLAADLPFRYRNDKEKGALAVDDALGRESHGLRLAVVGRLTGDRTEAIYQAMCALFLQPANTLLFDDYSNRKGSFGMYLQDDAARLLGARMSVTHVTGDDVTAAMFRKLTRTGDGFDMLWLNTSGGSTYMDLRGGRGVTDDMPLGHACVIHAIHSWSMQYYDDPDTLAGRAIIGGCYWYFGSVNEPTLGAFTDPTFMAERAICGTPLAFCARQILPPQPMYKPWKLMLVGDPLFVLRDKPADRITSKSSLPPDCTAVEVTRSITPDNFRIAAMSFPQAADLLAPRMLAEPHKLDSSDLASAMWFADKAGRTQLVADVPIDLAMKHPIAEALLLRNADYQAKDLVDSDDPAAAEPYLATVFGLTPDRKSAASLIDAYLAAMSKKQLAEQAHRFLTTQRDNPGVTSQAKAALTDALAPAEPAKNP